MRLARFAAIGAVAGLAMIGLASPPAAADTGTVNYTCTASILTNQPFTVVVHGTAPETAAVGDTIELTGLSADVTVNANATGALYWFLGARSIEGPAQADISVDNAGTSVPLPAAALTVPATPVPASGALTVVAAGTGASFVTTTAGTVSFEAGPFNAQLVATNSTGGTSNVPVACTPDSGQDLTIATTTVA